MDVAQYLGSQEPWKIFNTWMKLAQDHPSILEPTAMVLSTIDQKSHSPDSRVVLAKDFQEGITFYTNTKSVKGEQLSQNFNCSLLFYWDPLCKQVRLQGEARLISREKTIEYWNSRPRESQLSQWISKQSTPVKNRQILTAQIEEAQKKFLNQPIPCPQAWSGYFVDVRQIEFWQSREYRLHDRFLFKKEDAQWNIQRLYP